MADITIDHDRVLEVLHDRGTTLAAVARAARREVRHLHRVTRGERKLVEPLRGALQAALGPAGWSYCIGQGPRP